MCLSRLWRDRLPPTPCSQTPAEFQRRCFRSHPVGVSILSPQFYSPDLTRWLSRDLLDERDELNLYFAFNNDPVNEIDIVGLKAMTEKECRDFVIKKAWKDKKIATLVSKMKKHKPKPCSIPVVICKCCADEYCGYSGAKNRIDLCYNKNESKQELLETYRHELIHAWNECSGWGGESCDEAVCDEILASYYSGV